MPDSNIVRSGGREIASRGYNFLVRTILGSRLYDHQCGFKAFRRDRILELIRRSRPRTGSGTPGRWCAGRRKGYGTADCPVVTPQGRRTTFSQKTF